MAPQEIKKIMAEKPFMPFRLCLSDGKAYEILDASDATVDLLAVHVSVDPDEESGLFQRTIRISPNHVVRIEPLPELRAK